MSNYDFWLSQELAELRVREMRHRAETVNRPRQSGLLRQAWWSRRRFWLLSHLRGLPVALRERLKQSNR